jgi:hypothetical protein
MINNKIFFPKSVKDLTLNYNEFILNNIPKQIEKIKIDFKNDNNIKLIDNLPSTIREITIKKECYKKYIKCPFGTNLIIKTDDFY